MIQSGNWRRARHPARELGGARDPARELEWSTSSSQGTGREHVIQSGNWRGARHPARELEGST